MKLFGVGLLVFSTLIIGCCASETYHCGVDISLNFHDLSHEQENCLLHQLSRLAPEAKHKLYDKLSQELLEESSPSFRAERDNDSHEIDYFRRGIRNKRTLQFLIQSLSNMMGVRSALAGFSAFPMMLSGPMGTQRASNSSKTPPPPKASPRPMSTPIPTIPPNQIDANTIRYPFRPAPAIPFVAFAPLPQGVTVPYPPLLQWPTPAATPSTQGKMPNPPCPCASSTPAPKPPSTMPPMMNVNAKPHLPVSSSLYSGGFKSTFLKNQHPNDFLDYGSNSQAENDPVFDHGNYLSDGESFNHEGEVMEYSNPQSDDDEDSSYHYTSSPDDDDIGEPSFAKQDEEEARYMQLRENNSKNKNRPKSARIRKYSMYSMPTSLNAFWHVNRPQNNIRLPSSRKPVKFRIIVPPLLPRKRRDIFFDEAFKSFNLSSFDSWNLDKTQQPESTQAQFLQGEDVLVDQTRQPESTQAQFLQGEDVLVPSPDYRKKLEQDLEKYVEHYVEQQINGGQIDTRKPKTTIIELKTKEGPPIKTITTTLSKIVEGDQPLIESILEFSKTINPVSNPGEFSGEPNGESLPPKQAEQSEVKKAFESDDFKSFSWS